MRTLWTSMCLLVAAAIASVVWIPAASAAVGATCADRYEEAEWTTTRDGGVTVQVTGIAEGLAARFTREVAIVESWLVDEIGSVDVMVCLVGEESTFDDSRYREGSQLFHIVSDLDEGFLSMNTDRATLFVAPAMAFGLSQHALYQANGNEPFPEPISSAISHYYRARILDRLPYHHRSERGLNLYETESVVDWTTGAQATHQEWDPEENVSTIGDFVAFAVAREGSEVLGASDNETWSEIEAAWRTSLRIELVGTADPSTGWKGGAIAVSSVFLIAILVAGLGIWRKNRVTDRPATDPPIPGFFRDGDTSSTPSSGSRSD